MLVLMNDKPGFDQHILFCNIQYFAGIEVSPAICSVYSAPGSMFHHIRNMMKLRSADFGYLIFLIEFRKKIQFYFRKWFRDQQ